MPAAYDGMNFTLLFVRIISFIKQTLRQKAGGVGMRSKYIRRIGILCALFLILTATAIGLVYSGVVLLNQPSESEYPVRGVAVLADRKSVV